MSWYHPAITGRPVIFVVDSREYDAYKAAIQQALAVASAAEGAHAPPVVEETKPSKRYTFAQWSPNVYLVGCGFTRNANLANDNQMFGFGLNRLCVQQFAANQNIPLYWMSDDNVVHIGGIPRDLSTVEAILPAKNLAALSFTGAAQEEIVNPANSKTFNYRVLPANGKIGAMDCVFMEQVYVFRTAEIGRFRFSPLFQFSKEDVSYSNALKASGKKFQCVSLGQGVLILGVAINFTRFTHS
jgi:hypothetical protein